MKKRQLPLDKGESEKKFKETLSSVSTQYVALERAIRKVIDEVVGPVCARCQRVCYRSSYCRNTLLNP